MDHLVQNYWPQILGVVAIIVWAVRVEAAVKEVNADIEGLKEQRKEDRQAAEVSRKEVHETLSTMQSDIKDILRAVGGKER